LKKQGFRKICFGKQKQIALSRVAGLGV